MSEQDYEQLTLFQGDSPVSHSVWLESRKAKGMTVTCGLKCSELSESCARIASSVRTYLESSSLPPGRWSRIWSAQAITLSCLILKLRLSELGTEEAGCSLWATPNTMDSMDCRSYEAMKSQAQHGGRKGRRRPSNLREQVDPLMCRAYEDAAAEKRRLWPTPAARDYKGANSMEHLTKPKMPGNKNHTGQLANAVKLFTTPCAADSEGSTGGTNHRSLRTDVNGQLNPTWVEWLMGFPTGWTDLNA